MTLVRPNKLRLEVYRAKVVSDGNEMTARIDFLPDQVMRRAPVPAKLTDKWIYLDPALWDVMTEDVAGPCWQLPLLLHENAIGQALSSEDEPQLLEPDTIDSHECYRVQMRRPDGAATLWIDRETFVLRRIEFPTGLLREHLAQATGTPVDSAALVAELSAARFTDQIEPTVFQLAVPAEARVVKFFVSPTPFELLGRRVPDFRFADLEGNPVTSRAIERKVAVLTFGATLFPEHLRMLEGLRRKYSGDERVALLAACVEPRQTPNEKLLAACERVGAAVSLVRDPDNCFETMFKTRTIDARLPALFLIDAKGTVQFLELAGDPGKLATTLPGKIDKLLAGEDVYRAQLDQYEGFLHDLERKLDDEAARLVAAAEGKSVQTFELPASTVAPATGWRWRISSCRCPASTTR